MVSMNRPSYNKKIAGRAAILWLLCLAAFFIVASSSSNRQSTSFETIIILVSFIVGSISFIAMLLGAINVFSVPSTSKSVARSESIEKEDLKPKIHNVNSKKINPWAIMSIILLMAVVFLIARLSGWITPPLTRDECYRLGSNERTLLCLQEIERRNPGPTPILLNGSGFQIINATANGDNFPITITNNSGYSVQNVVVKFIFYKESPKENPTCGVLKPIDTQYWKLSGIIGIGDVRTVTAYVPTAMRWGSFCTQIEGAQAL
jgi:hypothetical protein